MTKKLNFTFPVDVHSARNGYLTPNAKAVMLVYRSYADKHGKAWPSQETIRKHTRLSRNTIQKCIVELEDHHILKLIKKGVKGKYADTYRVANCHHLSTSMYHSFEYAELYGESSISGLTASQYAAVKDRFVSEPQEFEEVEF